MREDKLTELLTKLADLTNEPVRPDLDEDIRRQIPQRLIRHKVNWNAISIGDLRLSRFVAAAAIIITLFFCGTFVGAWNTTAGQIYRDSKLLIGYGFAGENIGRSDVLASLEALQQQLSEQGRRAVFYSEGVDRDDMYSVLMHWKLADGQYRVLFNDLSVRTVSPAVLIRLQAYMLEQRADR